MKRILSILFALVLVVTLGLVTAVPVGAVDNEVWVDDNAEADWYQDATHFETIQAAVAAVAPGGTVNVAAGEYNERLTINKPLDLRGAKFEVDPTQTGARTTPADESTIDVSGLSYIEPHIAVEVSNGVNNVVIDGFTIIGRPNFKKSDDSVIACGRSGTNNDITISNNMIDGYVGILFNSGDSLTVQQNDITFNKNAIVIHSGCTAIDISDNTMAGGTSMETDPYGIYITSTTGSITGNTIENIIAPDDRGKGIAGSSNHDLLIDDNVINNTGYDGISFWANTHHVTISNNTLSNNAQTYTKGAGITIKGDDLTIIYNDITGSGHDGIVIDKHTLASLRIDINYNNIWGNADYGVNVMDADEIVDATLNWWGSANGPGQDGANDVSGNVLFAPWLKAPSRPTTPMSSFTIDHAKVDFKKKADDDKVRVQGKLELDLVNSDGVDISEDITVTVGSLDETIKMVEKGKKGEKWHYQRPKGGEGNIKHMTINWKNGKFDIRMDKADLTGVTNPVIISVQIGDDVGSESILMREKKHHWDYKAK